MAPRLVVTGASGYIGRQFVQRALARGYEITVLGRSPVAGLAGHPWRLGDRPPPALLQGAAALVHLAQAWAADADAVDGENPNIYGAETLLQAAAEADIPCFVLASTTSARPDALNAYGRMKAGLEQRLLRGEFGDRVRIARIGLVYGGPRRAMYGLTLRVAALSPLLPMIGLDRKVQPIHLDEVCEGLLRLATQPDAGPDVYVLAGATPMPFADWLRLLCRLQTGRRLRFLPVPIALALFGCRLTALLPFLPTIDPERVLGLAGAAPMDSAPSLARLDLKPVDPVTRLQRELAQRPCPREAAEAHALLRYLGTPRPSLGMLRRLMTGLRREGLAPLGLPKGLLRHPAAIAVFEPPANRQESKLARALYLADLVTEAEGPPRRTGFLRNLLRIAGDLVLLPVRLFLAGRFR
jgi:nucleoside-diphosphate-sugar epimerase